MIDSDKREFKNLMADTMVIYERELTEPLLRMWWTSLLRFDISDVRAALGRYIQNAKTGKFSPKPADIIGIIETMHPDGRIGVEEAWALYPHNESDSAVITQEMAAAMTAAQPLIDEGDRIAARMAFKEAYLRIVEQNKLNGVKPVWYPTLGHDPNGREEVLKQAVELGRLQLSQIQHLLPVRYDQKVIAAVGQLKQINAPLTDEEKAQAKQKMAKIKEIFNGA